MGQRESKKLVVCLVVSNLQYGGAERQVVQIANNLNRDRFEIHVISLSDLNPLADNLASDVAFHQIGVDSGNFLTKLLPVIFRIRKIAPDVLHAFLYDAEIASRIAGWLNRVPLVLGSERNSDYQVSRSKSQLKRMTSSMMDYCIANTRAGASYNQKIQKLANDRYLVIRNGVDLNRFRPVSREERLERLVQADLDPTKTYVGMFASFKAQKNHPMLIEAAELVEKRISDVHYLLVGDSLESGYGDTDGYKASLMQMLEHSSLNSRIHLLGRQTDVERLYGCCELTVLPSLHEGLPNVLLESMCVGVPFVATDVADNGLLVEKLDVGRLVEVGNVKEFADAICDTLSQSDTNISADKLSSVRDYLSNERMIDDISKVYSGDLEHARYA